jgi:hypothetical protein
MEKKGELTLQFLIMLILAVIALFVVLWIFKDQIIDFVSTIKDTTGTLDTGVENAVDRLTSG